MPATTADSRPMHRGRIRDRLEMDASRTAHPPTELTDGLRSLSAMHARDIESAIPLILFVNISRTVQQQPTEGPRKTRRSKRKRRKKRKSAYE
ncbi:hypothetical protein EVAR_24719_1 [Eumeta japonica]|uniref:Uncharacterized protein n=1 Tax=Eumeta variegata TaxID=151549 RepID=A0A4C1VD41_EUMVA|nr:hypothetical protein EVAR_24719_1 [Eumeta japonica]